ALIPVSGVLPFEFQANSTVADRYAYLPMLGFAGAAAFLFARQRWAVPVVVASLAILSWRQLSEWAEPTELFRHTLAVNPGS
ncbi:hypothetical protein ACXYUI_31340, partial [Klebsiella pneumoniae]